MTGAWHNPRDTEPDPEDRPEYALTLYVNPLILALALFLFGVTIGAVIGVQRGWELHITHMENIDAQVRL